MTTITAELTFEQKVNNSKNYLKDNPFVTGQDWDYLYDNFLVKQVDHPTGGQYYLSVNGEKYMAQIVDNGMVRLYPY